MFDIVMCLNRLIKDIKTQRNEKKYIFKLNIEIYLFRILTEFKNYKIYDEYLQSSRQHKNLRCTLFACYFPKILHPRPKGTCAHNVGLCSRKDTITLLKTIKCSRQFYFHYFRGKTGHAKIKL